MPLIGTGFAEVDLLGRVIDLKHIDFTPQRGKLTARFERKVFDTPIIRRKPLFTLD